MNFPGELRERLTGPNAGKLQRSLRDFGMSISKANERKAWQYIETRASLLLRAYPTTAEVWKRGSSGITQNQGPYLNYCFVITTSPSEQNLNEICFIYSTGGWT